MSDEAEFFSGMKQKKDEAIPEGMSVWEYKRLKEQQETAQYLDRGNSYVVRDKEGLAALMDRGEVFLASELAQREEAERQAAIALQNAIEEQERARRYQRPKEGGSISPTWQRESLEE